MIVIWLALVLFNIIHSVSYVSINTLKLRGHLDASLTVGPPVAAAASRV